MKNRLTKLDPIAVKPKGRNKKRDFRPLQERPVIFKRYFSIQSFTNTTYPGHYNGLVNAMRWKNSISNVIDRSGAGLTDLSLYSDGSVVHELAMLFQYDERNQLASSTFARYDNSAETAILLNPFKVYGENNGNIGYDANGNITSLLRDGYLAGGSNSPMDILSYTYADNSNKLISIADNSTSSINYNDFQTSGTQGMDYNDDGELVASAAEGVTGIDYYATGRVKKVTYSDGNTAEYFYNERGMKTRQTFKDNNSTGTPSVHTWYMGDAEVSAIYEKDETSANPEAINLVEQPIYCAVRAGVYYKTAGKTLYEIADHLGNVRAVVSNNNGTPAVESWADYYPHGGVMPGRNAVTTPYRYNYQGTENALASRWKNFNLRMYNVDLGRFNTPDPYGQFYSSYLGMGNNPVSAIDPTGGYCLCAAESGDMAWENVPWEIYFGGYGDQWSTGIGGGSGGAGGSGGNGTVALLDGVIPISGSELQTLFNSGTLEVTSFGNALQDAVMGSVARGTIGKGYAAAAGIPAQSLPHEEDIGYSKPYKVGNLTESDQKFLAQQDLISKMLEANINLTLETWNQLNAQYFAGRSETGGFSNIFGFEVNFTAQKRDNDYINTSAGIVFDLKGNIGYYISNTKHVMQKMGTRPALGWGFDVGANLMAGEVTSVADYINYSATTDFAWFGAGPWGFSFSNSNVFNNSGRVTSVGIGGFGLGGGYDSGITNSLGRSFNLFGP